MPPKAGNLERAWAACEDAGLELCLIEEPLDRPRDRLLAERVIARQVERYEGAGPAVEATGQMTITGLTHPVSFPVTPREAPQIRILQGAPPRRQVNGPPRFQSFFSFTT